MKPNAYIRRKDNHLITAVVALLLLPGLTAAVRLMGKLMALPPDAATQLALFHTLFNLLGVLLMWPLAERMVPGWQDCCVDSTIMSQPPRWSERAPG